MTLTAGYLQRFLAQIRFVDTSGGVVHPENVTISGPTGTVAVPASGEVWLPAAKDYSLISVIWDGSQMIGTPPYTQFSVAAPGAVNVTIPVYDETLLVEDIFGNPITGAQITFTLPDGTTRAATTGANGSGSFYQLPKGTLQLSVDYLGVSSSFTVDPSLQPTSSVTIALSYPVFALFGLVAGTAATVLVLKRKGKGPYWL